MRVKIHNNLVLLPNVVPLAVSFSANLFNTNRDFDWGVFTLLEDELALFSPPPTLFPLVFSMPGTYVLKLSSDQYKHMVTTTPSFGRVVCD